MAMPVNMIYVMYAILCLILLSYDFTKLTMLFIDVHISLISMTNKSGLTFFLSIKYLSVCLSVCLVCLSVCTFSMYFKTILNFLQHEFASESYN